MFPELNECLFYSQDYFLKTRSKISGCILFNVVVSKPSSFLDLCFVCHIIGNYGDVNRSYHMTRVLCPKEKVPALNSARSHNILLKVLPALVSSRISSCSQECQ